MKQCTLQHMEKKKLQFSSLKRAVMGSPLETYPGPQKLVLNIRLTHTCIYMAAYS